MANRIPKDVRVIYQKPWWWWIKNLVHYAPFENLAFTIGNTIYATQKLTPQLMAHETAHVRHQRGSTIFGIFCFLRYRFSKTYRLKVEVDAYREQIKAGGDKKQCARALCSDIYGRMISYQEALRLL